MSKEFFIAYDKNTGNIKECFLPTRRRCSVCEKSFNHPKQTEYEDECLICRLLPPKKKDNVIAMLNGTSISVHPKLYKFIRRRYDDKLIRHKILGQLNGIPECCIAQFCEDQKNSVLSAKTRRVRPQDIYGEITKNYGYVPCNSCLAVIIKHQGS